MSAVRWSFFTAVQSPCVRSLLKDPGASHPGRPWISKINPAHKAGGSRSALYARNSSHPHRRRLGRCASLSGEAQIRSDPARRPARGWILIRISVAAPLERCRPPEFFSRCSFAAGGLGRPRRAARTRQLSTREHADPWFTKGRTFVGDGEGGCRETMTAGA